MPETRKSWISKALTGVVRNGARRRMIVFSRVDVGNDASARGMRKTKSRARRSHLYYTNKISKLVNKCIRPSWIRNRAAGCPQIVQIHDLDSNVKAGAETVSSSPRDAIQEKVFLLGMHESPWLQSITVSLHAADHQMPSCGHDHFKLLRVLSCTGGPASFGAPSVEPLDYKYIMRSIDACCRLQWEFIPTLFRAIWLVLQLCYYCVVRLIRSECFLAHPETFFLVWVAFTGLLTYFFAGILLFHASTVTAAGIVAFDILYYQCRPATDRFVAATNRARCELFFYSLLRARFHLINMGIYLWCGIVMIRER